MSTTITDTIVRLGEHGEVTIPEDVRAALNLQPGQPVRLVANGEGVVLQPIEIDPEQAWFWTPEWQAKEREADQAYAEGRFTRYYSVDEFLDSLDGDSEE